ncbi:MAG: hypothetical protein ABI706_13980 [Ilumatobacteraceae bacterium]
MFDDPDAFDGIVQAIFAIVAAFLVANAIVLTLATWGISHWARRRGRRGSRVAAFVVALGVEVFVVAALTALLGTHRANATIVSCLLGSAVVLGAATVRLCRTNPAVDVGRDTHLAR